MNAADGLQIPDSSAKGEVALYDKSTKLGAFAGGKCFKTLGEVVTFIYMVWIGIDVDFNAAESITEAAHIFIFMHTFFVVFFVTEALVRVYLVGRKITKCPALTWDIFLALLLLLQPVPSLAGVVGNMSILRLLNCLQLSRGVRFFQLPTKAETASEMADKTKFRAAAEVVFCTFMFTMFLQYSFSIIFRNLVGENGEGEKYFKSVAEGMYNLFFDISGVSDALKADGPFPFAVYVIFLMIVIAVWLLTLRTLVARLRTSQARSPLNSSVGKEEDAEIERE